MIGIIRAGVAALLLTAGAADAATAAATATAAAATTTAAVTASPNNATTAATTATPLVEQPRRTGYFVGDLLEQRVLLEAAGHSLTPLALPSPGRVSAWFERRQVSIAKDPALRRWLVVEYQILNAPPKLATVTLPEWRLAAKDSTGATRPLRIPAASLNIAPLSPPGTPEQVGTGDLRPDRLPPIVAIAPLRRMILYLAGAWALTLIAWFVWTTWRNKRALETQPFARALREMRRLDGKGPLAWQALHRAFDETAGCVVQSATVSALFARAPHLAPLRARIEQFYAQSSLLFFAAPAAVSAAAATEIAPLDLCLELRRVERRYES